MNGDARGLSDLNPAGRFTGRERDYARYRPGYPAAAIDAALEGLGDPRSLRAADVGAGTGISARLLADRGVRVLAVEPNAAMRAAAEPHPLVEWVDGTAEKTGLADTSLDLVLCAQAFHWFRPTEALAEFARVLRPGGRACAMWNAADQDSAFAKGYYAAVLSATPEGKRVADTREYESPFAGRPGWRELPVVRAGYEQRFDREGLMGRARSASYVPTEGPAAEAVFATLDRLFDEHAVGGRVVLRYTTTVYRAERADSSR
jgi:SAM-dependent methyltransferase